MKKKTVDFFFPIFLAIVCMIIFSSCKGRPTHVLDEDEMVSLLADMELTEAYANAQGKSNMEKIEMGRRVLKAHDVSEESLDTTLAWYGRNMDKYSELFDKVDKEILRKKALLTDDPAELIKDADNLWPYGSHQIISQLSGSDAMIFTLPEPKIEKGKMIKMIFSLPNSPSMKGTLGVEYMEGGGEAVIGNFVGKRHIEIELQPDTAFRIKRLYGVMEVKDNKALPVFIDSISIIAEPMDSTNYRIKRRAQKKFGPITQRKPEIKDTVKPVKTDTVEEPVKFSVKKTDQRQEQNLRRNNHPGT